MRKAFTTALATTLLSLVPDVHGQEIINGQMILSQFDYNAAVKNNDYLLVYFYR